MNVDIIIETAVSHTNELIPFMETITIKDVNLFRVSTSEKEKKVIFNINQYKFEYKKDEFPPKVRFYDLVMQKEVATTYMDRDRFLKFYKEYKNNIENITISLAKRELYDEEPEYRVDIEYQLKY